MVEFILFLLGNFFSFLVSQVLSPFEVAAY